MYAEVKEGQQLFLSLQSPHSFFERGSVTKPRSRLARASFFFSALHSGGISDIGTATSLHMGAEILAQVVMLAQYVLTLAELFRQLLIP